MDLSLVPYQQQEEDDNNSKKKKIRYRECMRNHAASIGGHANDGCGEFMPRDNSCDRTSSTDSLICAACGCHRNFHRRESPFDGGESSPFHHHHLIHAPPPPMLLYKAYHHQGGSGGGGVMAAVDHSRSDFDRRSETPEREEVNLNVGPGSRSGRGKRHRTKFTQEQKERMLEFAERIGWRMNRQDDVALNQFCAEVGITRNVLKVWMHNNKNAHRRRESPSQPPVVAAPPPPQTVEG
ncbi:hypothetical protein ACOSQ2_009598 [Xanthoceras sorbifolium]